MKKRFPFLGSHYRIERFGVMMAVLCTCMLFVVFSVMVRIRRENADTLSGQVLYVDSFVTSRSGVAGHVEDVYVSGDKTKCFILIKMDSMSAMSTDANNYTVYVTGCNPPPNVSLDDLDSNPSGTFYVFGSTGYMGVYLEELESGFPKQILQVLVRSSRDLSVSATLSAAGFDQFALYLNPGGDYGKSADFLEAADGGINVADMFEEAVVRANEAAIKEKLSDRMSEFVSDMGLIVEYSERVARDGLVLNPTPDAIAGDRILDGEGNVVASLVPGEGKGLVGAASGLYFDGVFLTPGGVDFAWQDGSVSEGYLKDVAPGMTSAQFFSGLQAESEYVSLGTDGMFWYYPDGTKFEAPVTGDGSGSTVTDTVKKDIEDLVGAWASYWSHKMDYQRELLPSLLRLEVRVQDYGQSYTVHEDAVVTW